MVVGGAAAVDVGEAPGEFGRGVGEAVAGPGQRADQRLQEGLWGVGIAGQVAQCRDQGAGGFDVGGDLDGRGGEGGGVADAQGGQCRAEPAAGGGVVRGAGVHGEQLGGLGRVGPRGQVVGQGGVGGQLLADEPFGEPVGLQAVPRTGGIGRRVQVGDPPADGVPAVLGLVGQRGDARQDSVGAGGVGGAEQERRGQCVVQGGLAQHRRQQPEPACAVRPVPPLVAQQPVLDRTRTGPGEPAPVVAGGRVLRAGGPEQVGGVEQVGQRGHVQGQRRDRAAPRRGRPSGEPGCDRGPVMPVLARHCGQRGGQGVYRLPVGLGLTFGVGFERVQPGDRRAVE